MQCTHATNIYWLNNRQPERWRNRVEVDTEDKKEIRVIVGMEGLTDETETKEIAK